MSKSTKIYSIKEAILQLDESVILEAYMESKGNSNVRHSTGIILAHLQGLDKQGLLKATSTHLSSFGIGAKDEMTLAITIGILSALAELYYIEHKDGGLGR